MLKSVIRTLLAIVLGMALAFALIVAVEWFSAVVYPNPADIRQMGEHVKRYPAWILAVVVLAWGATIAVATWVATRVGNWIAGSVVALLLALALIFNLLSLPYAMWFKIVMFSAFPVACILGIRSGRRFARS